MRIAIYTAFLTLMLAGLSRAADNPLGAASSGGKNPLGIDAAPSDPLAGTFANEKLSLVLKSDGGQKYSGVIKMGGNEYPATATGDPKALKGSFISGGQSYEFTAALNGNELVLSSGGKDYALTRKSGVNPLGADPDKTAAPAEHVTAGAPGKLEVIQSTQSGQALFEAREGTRSAKALLIQSVADLSNYLGVKPAVVGGFADTKDLRGGASFTAKVRDHAIKGMIFVGVGEKGGAITVVFDSADAPMKNLAALAAAVQPPAELKWEDARLPDGSGTMRLPTGYRITGAVNGAVDVVGPAGQIIELGLAYPIWTPEQQRAFEQQQIAIGLRPSPPTVPVAPMPRDAPSALAEMIPVFSRTIEASGGAPIKLEKIIEVIPAPGMPGAASYIHCITSQGKGDAAARYHSFALVSVSASAPGQWLYYTSYVVAPEATFAQDLPTMMQIWASWKVSDAVLKARLNKAMEDMKSTSKMMEQSNAYAQKVRHDSNADFDEVIRGYRTVEDTETGERHEANLGYVDKIVEKMNEHAGYERYKEIPLRDQ